MSNYKPNPKFEQEMSKKLQPQLDKLSRETQDEVAKKLQREPTAQEVAEALKKKLK